MYYEAGTGVRKSAVTTESPLDRMVKWLSVYFIGLLALVLLLKEHVLGKSSSHEFIYKLDPVLSRVCQRKGSFCYIKFMIRKLEFICLSSIYKYRTTGDFFLHMISVTPVWKFSVNCQGNENYS